MDDRNDAIQQREEQISLLTSAAKTTCAAVGAGARGGPRVSLCHFGTRDDVAVPSGTSAHSPYEQRFFDWLLPAVACMFVFLSIPRQMKNFLASGLLFLAIGLYRLQQDVFPGGGGWPVLLLASGLALMIATTNYAPMRVAAARIMRRVR